MMKKSGNNKVDMLVGRNIRIYRLGRALSQTEFGDKLEITFQTVQKIEKGTLSLKSEQLFRISQILGVSLSMLFEGAQPEDVQARSP